MNPDIIIKVGDQATDRLAGLLNQVFDAVDIDEFVAARDSVLTDFRAAMQAAFADCAGIEAQRPNVELDFDTLFLVQDDDLEILVALDGMVNSARNLHLQQIIPFCTRLKALLGHDNVDESNNPLDPSQVATAFKDALSSLSAEVQNSLAVYRRFNSVVLYGMGDVLAAANGQLADAGVLTDLEVETPEPVPAGARFHGREDDDAPEVFNVVQKLLHAEGETGDGGGVISQSTLMEVLSGIEKGNPEDIDPAAIRRQLDAIRAGGEEALALDRKSADVIDLVTMLYDAIWQDNAVPPSIRQLLGQTQITVVKVALSDTGFFDREQHPARVLLNEIAEAGISLADQQEVEETPLYQRMQDLVRQVNQEYAGDVTLFEQIVADFRQFREDQQPESAALEQSIGESTERKERLDDIHELVSQKIDERMLGRDLHPVINEILEGPFHKFMVMLVLKEGPGTNAWKQAINTIDVLLWSVQNHDDAGDLSRLESIRPRLRNNLRKAFRIAQLPADEIEACLNRLDEAQSGSFDNDDLADVPTLTDVENVAPAGGESPLESTGAEASEVNALPPDAFELEQVDALHVGIWVEFVEEPEPVRCKLAAKITAIDKLIFVNRQGVKVVEKTRMGLAREIRDGTVRIVSDGLLFSRALESVIGNLRESQQEQQTGSAYQPDKGAEPESDG